MARHPPFDLDEVDLPDLLDRGIELAVVVDRLKQQCACKPYDAGPRPKPHNPNPDRSGFFEDRYGTDEVLYLEHTIIQSYDKWWLKQCETCGAIFWVHDVQGDYGDPRMDHR